MTGGYFTRDSCVVIKQKWSFLELLEVSFPLVFKVIFAAWYPFQRWNQLEWDAEKDEAKLVIVYTKFIIILSGILYRVLTNNNDLDGLIGSDSHLSTIRRRPFTLVTFQILSNQYDVAESSFFLTSKTHRCQRQNSRLFLEIGQV